MFRSMSVKRKLFVVLLATGALPLLVAFSSLATYGYFASREDLARELTTVADVTASHSAAAVVFGDSPAAERMLGGLRAQPDVVGACLYDDSRRLFASYTRKADAFACPRAQPGTNLLFGPVWLEIVRPAMLEGDPVGVLYIRSTLGAIHARLKR